MPKLMKRLLHCAYTDGRTNSNDMKTLFFALSVGYWFRVRIENVLFENRQTARQKDKIYIINKLYNPLYCTKTESAI